ncbi:MAG: site-2 protease family protein [Clostridiales bacterium]|jgi:Zn-dependent protease|nr:site-2 protease family protein [Clostridiales bacterium]
MAPDLIPEFGSINLLYFVAKVPAILIAVVLHEYIKALVSTKLGDPIPKEKGRLTLNPFKHLDAFGTICFFFWNYGWGNPVQTSPIHYKDREQGTLMTYIIPSVANLFVGVMFGIVYNFFNANVLLELNPAEQPAMMFYLVDGICWVLYWIAFHNIAMALFNIVPVFPLDGYKVLNLFLKPTWVIKLQQSEMILQIILMAALFLQVIQSIYDPAVRLLMGLVWF